jgi:hypothetical protein
MQNIVIKLLMKGYNFPSNLISPRGLHEKLWVSQMERIPILKIVGLSTWESWEKHHLDATLVVCHRKYYKRGGGGFPWVRAMMSCESMYARDLYSTYALNDLLFGLWRLI